MVVRISEWNAEAYQVVRQVRGVGVSISGRQEGAVAINHQSSKHGWQNAQAQTEVPHAVKEWLLVFLQILVVCKRKTLERHEQRDKIANRATALAANEFAGIGILLLRHQTGSAGERIRQFNQFRFAGGVEDQIFSHARKVQRAQGASRERFHHEITVAHCIQ